MWWSLAHYQCETTQQCCVFMPFEMPLSYLQFLHGALYQIRAFPEVQQRLNMWHDAQDPRSTHHFCTSCLSNSFTHSPRWPEAASLLDVSHGKGLVCTLPVCPPTPFQKYVGLPEHLCHVYEPCADVLIPHSLQSRCRHVHLEKNILPAVNFFDGIWGQNVVHQLLDVGFRVIYTTLQDPVDCTE